jgi:hypothetical protein
MQAKNNFTGPIVVCPAAKKQTLNMIDVKNFDDCSLGMTRKMFKKNKSVFLALPREGIFG